MISLIQKQKYNKGIKENGLINLSGTRLANSLGISISTPKIKAPKSTDILINWGLTDLGVNNRLTEEIYNHPDYVKRSSNKIETLRLLSANNIPSPITFTSYSEAHDYLECNPDKKIVCRTLVNSTNGKGIVIAKTLDELVDCRLYTVYFPKKWELRFHVAFGKVIHIQQKRRLSSEQLESRGIINRSKYIRNLANGYIYSDKIDILSDAKHLQTSEASASDCPQASTPNELIGLIGMYCLEAIHVLELDFGAVDVLVNKDLEFILLETNSAPGLQGRTLDIYSLVFREELNL